MKNKRHGPLVLVPLRDPEKAYRVIRSLRYLVDRYRDDLRPSEFWTEGTYSPHPRFNNAYLFILRPSSSSEDEEKDSVTLARRAARTLEEMSGLRLDWAAGVRKSGAIWLLVKARAYRSGDYKLSRYYPTSDDLLALRDLMRARNRERERKRKRIRERER